MDFSRVFDECNSKSPLAAGGLAAFDAVEAAPEYTPLPPGIYIARVVRGEYTTTRAGADAYRLRSEVVDGPHTGKTIVRTWTFGAKALPYAKRDLAAFGLTTSAALLAPFPPVGREYRVWLVVALQRSDEGTEHNDIKRIDVIGVTDSPIADFVLPSEQAKGGADV